jgi:predicted phage replisome organizer
MSNSKKYFWLKLKDNFFNQKEIKKLRRIAGGDTYTIIYLKLQLLSIKKEGVLEFEGTEENLAEQLALEIDEDKDNIEITLRFLQANHLIEEIFEDNYLLTKVPECIGKECDSAERVRKHREKLKQSNLLQSNANLLQCNTPVTNSNTEIEIEKEIEKKKDNIFDENSTEFQLSLYLYELVNKNFTMKKPNLQTWATHIDKIIRIDGRSAEEIKKVIEWSQQDDFWKQNIRSTSKLRKQYAQLCMKMNTDKNFQYSKGIEKKKSSSSLNANSNYNYDINSLIEKMKSEV